MNYQNDSEFFQLLGRCQNLRRFNRLIEIGSLIGETMKLWMEKLQPDSMILSIDMMVPRTDPRWLEQRLGHDVYWKQWAMSYGHDLYIIDQDSRDPYSINLAKQLMHEVDVLFIDGGHDYATCLADWQNYGPLVRKGGIVAFHDLGREWPDVRKVWEQARVGHESFEHVVSPERYGIGVLYV